MRMSGSAARLPFPRIIILGGPQYGYVVVRREERIGVTRRVARTTLFDPS